MSMMDEIQSAVKSDSAVIGYRESIRCLKTGGARLAIIADNLPEKMGAEIRRDAGAAGTKLEVFDGGSKDLGTACGKPFPVSAMVIRN
jgi:large subunit ribosomal protein L30e